MNLEKIEQRCVEFLQKAERPLVLFSRLFKHVKEDPLCGQITEYDLLSFLKNHELFKVFEMSELFVEKSPKFTFPDTKKTKTYVALVTRIPTNEELLKMMINQLDSLVDALKKAQSTVRSNTDFKSIDKDQIEDTLKRATKLRENLINYLRGALSEDT